MAHTNLKAILRFPIYTTLNFPASPSATGCLQWSDDGQVFIMTKGSISILTPNYAAAIKAPKSRPISHDKSPDWFRTIIDFDKRKSQNWQEVSQDWSAVAFGSLDISLQAVAISPSNLTDDAGCIAAVLTSNMDLSLWAPDKNRIQGKWTQIQEVTTLLSRSPSENRPAVQAQATSITWSRQTDFGIDPAPNLDASLLAVGTRGGTLMFLRFENGAVRCVDDIKVADDWLIQLAFSPWSLVEKGKCEARLACGTANGGVNLLTVTQTLTSVPSTTGFGPVFSIRHEFQVHAEQVFDADKRCLSALTWIFCKGNRILVVCKPGLVSFIAPLHLCNLGWSGRRTLSLPSQRVSVGSSPLQAVSGVYYVSANDVLLVCLSDGSIHVVHHVSSEPSWTTPVSTNGLSSQRLSENTRLAFNQTQPQKIKYTDVNRIYGLIPFNNQGTLLWLQETCQPTDLNYMYDAKHHTTFVAAQLWRCPKESFLREFATTLDTAKTTEGSPIHLLGPFLLYLLNHSEVFPEVFGMLQCPPTTNINLSFDDMLSPSDLSSKPALRQDFRKCLSRYLLGSDCLLRLRMKLSVADLILRSLPECSARVECEKIACHLFDVISQIILRTLIHHLTSIATVLTLNDAPFVWRLTTQLSSECPPEPAAEAKILADTLLSIVSSTNPIRMTQENPMEEICPACDAVFLLESGAHAICANGHSWGRCSVTSFILSTGMIRKCTGCSRKAILPLSCKPSTGVANWLPKPAQSWLVEELLEAASRCLFCGNIFVSSL